MNKKYYIAYGSNLNLEKMKERCPKAKALGRGEIKGLELLLKGEKDNAYLTIEECEGGSVPIGVWEVTRSDEEALDKYEVFPNLYYKKDMNISYIDFEGKEERVTAFVYIMREENPKSLPNEEYMKVCIKGYEDFGFDPKGLRDLWER